MSKLNKEAFLAYSQHAYMTEFDQDVFRFCSKYPVGEEPIQNSIVFFQVQPTYTRAYTNTGVC